MGLFDSLGAGANSTPADPTSQGTGGFTDTLANVLDPGNVRKQIAGLFSGAKATASGNTKNLKPNVLAVDKNGNPLNGVRDWRVKISPPAKGSPVSIGTDNPLLNILARTGGVIFPYTPEVSVTHNARYEEQALTHSNYKNYFYNGSDVSAINIVGDFTVQNKDDALYLLACIYFFRSCTKMFFGANDANAGNPPPIVFLDGYGSYYFPHVSCVITSFQHTMPGDVDYLEVAYQQGSSTRNANLSTSSLGQQYARVPINSKINITVQPIYSRQNIYNNMSLTNFSKGSLLTGKGGFL